MIPREKLHREARRAVIVVGVFCVVPVFTLLAAIGVALAFPNIHLPPWSLPAVLLALLGILFGIVALQERRRPRCPACAKRFTAAAALRTTRCPRCFTVITSPQTPEEMAGVRRRQDAAYVRIAVYLAVFALGVPLVMWWLQARQVVPAGFDWLRALAPLLAGAALGIVAAPFVLWARRIRRNRLAEDAALASAYPTLMAVHEGRTFRLYFAPSMLCLARIAGAFNSEHDLDYVEGGLFLRPFLEYALRKKRRREALYDTIDPASPDLLTIDRRNVQIPRDRISGLEFLPAHKFRFRDRWRFGRGGVLSIARKDRKPLILSIRDAIPEAEVNAILHAWQGRTDGGTSPPSLPGPVTATAPRS
jgi:hypothetical protein